MKLPWPRSLFARLVGILLLGILLTIALSATLFVSERERLGRNAFHQGVSEEVAAAIDILDHVSADERPRWLHELSRRRLRLSIGALPAGQQFRPLGGHPLLTTLRTALPEHQFELYETAHPRFGHGVLLISTILSDGTPLQIRLPNAVLPNPLPHAEPAHHPLSALAALAALVLGITMLTWFAVRIVTRPLSQLAAAARALGEDPERTPLPTDGPLEVSQAAQAFNHMQGRIREHMNERTRILAAISHDLQTPITRLRLRAELIDDEDLRSRIQTDLDSMQGLIREGLDYARSMDGSAPAQAINLDHLLAALADDAAALGWELDILKQFDTTVSAQPKALQRALWNLIENGIKFGGQVEIDGERQGQHIQLRIRDQGPGLPEEALEKVFEPFYRLEHSRNRNTGGTGLGLAIARNLLRQQGGEVKLRNHADGGLVAEVSLLAATPGH